MISDKRNKNGIPYLIQNSDEEQTEKEEDVLEETPMKITGHYRFTFNRDIKRLMNKVKESLRMILFLCNNGTKMF